jgi:hypothetical protein
MKQMVTFPQSSTLLTGVTRTAKRSRLYSREFFCFPHIVHAHHQQVALAFDQNNVEAKNLFSPEGSLT